MRIRHEPDRHRFVAESDDRYLGVLEYEPLSGGGLDLRRTVVLDESSDPNVAARLVRWALAFAAVNGRGVVASCPFVASRLTHDPVLLGLLHAHARQRTREAAAKPSRFVARGA